jgi:hypothetical protein
MAHVPSEYRKEFPEVGSRARRFKRFERDLRAWLETPEGHFASWHARRAIDESQAAPDRARR